MVSSQLKEMETDVPIEDQNKMINIECILLERKESTSDGPRGKYLEIKTYPTEKAKFIDYNKFVEFYGNAISNEQNSAIPLEISVGDAGANIPIEKSDKKPDFRLLMEFLLEKIDLTLKSTDELTISSNYWAFLELPWEDYSEKGVCREVITEKKSNFDNEENNNLLFLLSHATKYEGKNLEPIKKNLDQEIKDIFSIISDLKQDESPSHFRLDNVHLSLHTTKETIKGLSWEKYNYMHFVMHGLSDGKIVLEVAKDYEAADSISIAELVETLNGKDFKLLFFSFCFSGGGIKNESLAFKILYEGISKYAIGYNYPVGGESASEFAKNFYGLLLNGKKDHEGRNDIKGVYMRSLDKYKANGTKKYIPLLYINK